MDTLERAIAAANSGDRRLAARLVAEVLQSDPRNAKAWLLMSGLRENLDEQVECLKRTLALDPDNKQANLRLTRVQGALEARQRVLAEAAKEPPSTLPVPGVEDSVSQGSPTSPLKRIGPFVVEKESSDADIRAMEELVGTETADAFAVTERTAETPVAPAIDRATEAPTVASEEAVAEAPAAAAEEAVEAKRGANVPLLLGMALLGVTFAFLLCYWLFSLYQSGAFAPYEYVPPQEQVPGTSAQVGSLHWSVNFWQDLGTELPGEERVQGRGSIRTKGRFIMVSLRLENNTAAFGTFDTPVLIYGGENELQPSKRARAWVPKEMRMSQFNKSMGRIAPGEIANIRLIFELPPGVTHPDGILVNDKTGTVIGQGAERLFPYPYTGEE